MAEQIGLITVTEPSSPASEAYRTLRMNLQYVSLDHPLRTLLVTSAGPGEGKSTTLANLAVTMAQAERRVVVVDCDLRRPCLHQVFGVSNDSGLTTMMLEEEALLNPPIQPSPIEGLSILPSGPLPPRPADLLGSQRMEKVLARLRDVADQILIDAPPLVPVVDALALATRVDGVLLVTSAGDTKRDHARLAVERLHKVNANLVGAVLNNVALDASIHTYYK